MRLLASAILALCIQSVCAQSILKDPKELSVLLNEIVVTGTGTEHYLKDAPVQTEVITGKDAVIPWLPLPETITTGSPQPLIRASEPAAAAALARTATWSP